MGLMHLKLAKKFPKNRKPKGRAVKMTQAKRRLLPGATRKPLSGKATTTRRAKLFRKAGVYLRTKTAQGLRWAIAALHPCSQSNIQAVGLPDDNHLPTHCTRMQRTITISPPESNCTTLSGANLDACSWNLMIVTTPWPEYPWLVCATKGNDEPRAFDYYLREGAVFHNGDIHPLTQWGSWYFYSYPNFMDTSKWADPAGPDANDVRKKYQKLRVVGKGTTTYLNASRLVDGGRIIAGQYPAASRFVDTFNPSSFDIPWDKIKEAIKATFCVPKVALDPGKVQHAAEHDHTLEAVELSHSHSIDRSLFAHTHQVTVPSHTHQVDITHGHSTAAEQVKLRPKGTVVIPSHQHRYTLPTHSHDMSHSHTLKADQLSHKHPYSFPDHAHHIGEHTHELDKDTLSHEHDEYRGDPEWSGTPKTKGPSSGSITGDILSNMPTQYTDTSLNLNITVSNSGRTGESGYTEGTTTANPAVTKELGIDEVDFYPQVTVQNLEGEKAKVTTGHGGSLVKYTAEHTMKADPVSRAADIKLPSQKTGPAEWTNKDPIVLFQEGCNQLKEKENVTTSPIHLVRNAVTPDIPDWYVSEPPTTENGLFYGDPKAVTWPARKGAYQVLRLENTELEDCQTGAATFYDLATTSSEITPEKYAQSFSVNTKGCGTWGIIYYRNISLATSVTLKSVQFTQGVVNPKGPFANLTPMQIDPDEVACQLVAAENKRLDHSYPADYNDLGKILGEILGVAKTVGKVVRGVAGAVQGVPIIGDVASSIGSLLSGLGL
nr:putative capsid protein [Uzakla insect-associated virus]